MRSLLAAITVVFLASTASAAEFVVTKTDDTADGSCDVSDCSLREAVLAANASAGDDAITLPSGTYLLSRTGAGNDDSDTGDLDVTDTLAVNGADRATTVIDGGDGTVSSPDRIFHVLAGSLTLRDLTVRNGNSGVDDGGGILNAGASALTLERCDILLNRTAGNGGGVYNTDAAATLTVTDGAISNNFAKNSGGGVFTGSVTTTITGTSFVDNTSTGISGGGGLLTTDNAPGTVTSVSGSTFDGNHVVGSDGGGIQSNSETTEISGSTLTNNTTTGSGGGLRTVGTGAGTRTTISDSTFTGNKARFSGGGVSSGSAATEISGTTFSENVAFQGSGGGVNTENAAAGTRTSISDSKILSNEASSVGGVLSNSVLTDVSNTVVSDNTSVVEKAGGILTDTNGAGTRLTISDSEVSRNAGIQSGSGGIDSDSETTEVLRTKIFDNASIASTGGGLRTTQAAPGTTTTITDSDISGNTSVVNGGGVDCHSQSLTVSGTTIAENQALAGSGGGLNANISASQATIINSTISGNLARDGGGGIVVGGATATLTQVTIADNSGSSGGGLSVYLGTEATFANTIVADNAGGNCEIVGTVVSAGLNLESADTCGFGSGDLKNTDPLLAGLADNGGPTRTRNLLPGSPAIDGGDNAVCASTDQRGLPRPLDGDGDGTEVCDIGALEYNRCGDGAVQAAAGEECDDGDSDNTDGCTNECRNAVCGDGFVEAGVEDCDDGTSNSDTAPDACRTDCAKAACGDGVLDAGEACDDGNTADDDGCSATCAVEKSESGGCSLVL